MHSNWRDCVAWRDENLTMSTSSNEACKLFDVTLSQLTGYYENKQFNGLAASIQSMLAADPDFILGQCLQLGTELLGSDHLLNNSDLYGHSLVLHSKASELNVTRREKLHVRAIQQMYRGALMDACECYEQILLESQTDMMALKFSQSCYFYMGESCRMRDSVARVMPFWNAATPMQNYLYGMLGFGLVETNRVDEGKKTALKGYEVNPADIWANHAVAHANEYSNNFEGGLKFIRDTEVDWSRCELLAAHNYWHMSLFYVEINKHEDAVQVLDSELLKSKSPMDLVNSASLLARLRMDGCSMNDYIDGKWLDLKNIYLGRIEEHGYLYYDIYMAMLLGICGTREEKEKYFKSFSDFLLSDCSMTEEKEDDLGILCTSKDCKSAKSFLLSINKEIGGDLLNAMFHFSQNEFEKVVDLLYPIRYSVYKIGGSNAQRDLINLILVNAALQCSSDIHKKLGFSLLNERLAFQPGSQLTNRIASRFMS